MFCNRVSPNLYESHSLTTCHSNSWWITGLPKLLFFAQVTVWADRSSLFFAIAVNSLFYWKFMLLTAMGKRFSFLHDTLHICTTFRLFSGFTL